MYKNIFVIAALLGAITGCSDDAPDPPDVDASVAADATPLDPVTFVVNLAEAEQDVSILTSVEATASAPLVSATISDATAILYDERDVAHPSAVSYDDSTDTIVVQPSVPLIREHSYRFVLDNVEAQSGAAVPAVSLSFSTAPDNPLLRSIQYDAMGLIISYRGPHETDPAIVLIRYNDPGADLEWFTSDDVVQSYTRQELPSPDLRYDTAHTEPGPDGIWFTADDPIARYRHFTLDGNGLSLTRTDFVAPGPDGEWMTADDVSQLYWWWLREPDGRFNFLAVSIDIGPDDIWGSADDNVIIALRQLYEDHRPVRRLGLSEPGADNQWGSEDDVVGNYVDTVYDAAGLLATSYSTFNDVGVDGTWFTEDDVLSSYMTISYDNNNLPIGLDDYNDPGLDQEWMTADDVQDWYERTDYDIRGNRLESWQVSSPGADGIWDNADDPLSSHLLYTSTAGLAPLRRAIATDRSLLRQLSALVPVDS